MNAHQAQHSSPSMNPRQILMILFRNKWKIILFALLGVAAAAGVYQTQVPPYESTARVFVRYVVESEGFAPTDEGYNIKSTDSRGGVLQVEREILTSHDLALQVASEVDPSLVLGQPVDDGTNSVRAAAAQINGNTMVSASGNILYITYRNPAPAATVPVLSQILTNYYKEHYKAHRSLGQLEMLQRDTELKKSQLEKVQRDRANLRNSLGVTTSVEEEKSRIATTISTLENDIINSQTELALLQARMSDKQQRALAAAGDAAEETVAPPIDEAVVTAYGGVLQRLDMFRGSWLSLSGQFTPEHPRMRVMAENIMALEREKAEMEAAHPGLLTMVRPDPGSGRGSSAADDASALAVAANALQQKIRLLNDRLSASTNRMQRIIESEPRLRDMDRDYALLEESYHHFSSSLERAEFDEALDPRFASNFKLLQSPTAPRQNHEERMKLAGGAFAIFLALGIGLAFAREFVFDQSVQSPIDVESKLQLPLFMTIPKLADRQVVKLLGPGDSKKSKSKPGEEVAQPKRMPWEVSHFIRPYCEALRDRLIMYFQLKNLHHKPKLVAVTSCDEGSGTTTLAAGLAASLSETGDGKVLLVDMNVGRPEMHPFFRGNLASNLSDLLHQGSESGHGEKENLFLATAGGKNGQSSSLGPAKFYEMLPKLKSSDFDYIIFDMPAIKQTSSTVALSGFMDKVLLLVEPGRTNKESVKRATELMRQQQADVAGVVNRMPRSAAKWLEPDMA